MGQRYCCTRASDVHQPDVCPGSDRPASHGQHPACHQCHESDGSHTMSGYRARCAQRGVVLISSLLLLLVVTIIALSMFRSFGIQEKIAGNMREKQRALQAAVSVQQFAENWLSQNATAVPVVCNSLLNGKIGQGQICSNKLSAAV